LGFASLSANRLEQEARTPGSRRSVRRKAHYPGRRNEKTRRSGFFQALKLRLDNLDFLSLHAFLAAGSDERDLLAFFQALETVALDGAEVYEQVVTGLRGDEAEAFLIVEPLDGASLTIGHVNVSLKQILRKWTGTVRTNTECKEIGVVAMFGSKSEPVAIHGDTCSSSRCTIRLLCCEASFILLFCAVAGRMPRRPGF
jgi:hypothetical protein